MNQEIENFKQRWIEKGSFGDVFELEGYQPPAVLKSLSNRSPTDDHRVQFENECRILKELEHPNIVKFLGWLPKFGIIMEYCQNGNLKNVIKLLYQTIGFRRVMLSSSVIYTMNTVVRWGEELFDGLAYMHTKNLVHRDIKPENIFLTNEWKPKIGDLGFTKLIEMTMTGTHTGTHRYMSPRTPDDTRTALEQRDAGQQHSHRNDVYGLGLIMWELIERKFVSSVFEEYSSNWGFNYERFLIDVFTRELVGLQRLVCDERTSGLVARCTNFNRLLRPEAQEVTTNLRAILENDVFIASLDYTPLEKDEQKELIKPIGFNRTTDRILVKAEKL